MQKTTDKLIKKKLEEEAGASLKEALKKSILSPAERKAGEETARNVMEKRFAGMARAEVFKSAEYPEFIGKEGTAEEKKRYERLIKSLHEAEKKLRSLLGDNFIAISLVGSYAKGHAGKESDVDLGLLLRYGSVDIKEAFQILHETVGKAAKTTAQKHYNVLDYIKESVGKVGKNESDIGFLLLSLDILDFFSVTFGDGIHNARKEIIQEIAKSPESELIWNHVRRVHSDDVVQLMLSRSDEDKMTRLGVSREDFREILEARKEFALPSFDEMKKRYGVT